jgi:hypothetical protein
MSERSQIRQPSQYNHLNTTILIQIQPSQDNHLNTTTLVTHLHTILYADQIFQTTQHLYIFF